MPAWILKTISKNNAGRRDDLFCDSVSLTPDLANRSGLKMQMRHKGRIIKSSPSLASQSINKYQFI
jgi:hypothetical protein